MPAPLYTSENCRIAYQLHWSLTLFAKTALPPAEVWQPALEAAIESDGVRLLEYCESDPTNAQFFLSTKPEVSPSEVVRSVKGRLQYQLRASIPQLWQRHYSITSVGDTNHSVLQGYVAKQIEHHQVADPRAVEVLSQSQFNDVKVDLNRECTSSYGKFTNNLHVVLENAERLAEIRPEVFAASQKMLVGVCQKKEWRLSRVAFLPNHLHLLVGCGVTDKPCDVVFSIMNNLAYAHGMKAIYDFSFYVGTFGSYDHGAIRRNLKHD